MDNLGKVWAHFPLLSITESLLQKKKKQNLDCVLKTLFKILEVKGVEIFLENLKIL